MPDEPAIKVPYLKNASARKDSDGTYWLFIEGGGLKTTIRLSGIEDGEDSIPRRALEAWLAEPDKTDGQSPS